MPKSLISELDNFKYKVYSGASNIDLCDQETNQCLCMTIEQAEHMAKFWGESSYITELQS